MSRPIPRSARLLLLLVALFGLVLPPLRGQTMEEADSAAKEAKKKNALSLIPTRTMKFTTDEGTWISLDLSPDGRTIVFEILGDLYTIPVSGGAATRITSGLGFDMQPRFSPDGEEIVFISDRSGAENMWIANADGSDPRAVTKGKGKRYRSPGWTKDGKYILVSQAGLKLYGKKGEGPLRVEGPRPAGASPFGGTSLSGATFAPDERYIWVTLRGSGAGLVYLGGSDRRRGHQMEESSGRRIGSFQLGLFDRATGVTTFKTHEFEGAWRPVPSPDGRWVVYATRYDGDFALKFLDLRSREERWLKMGVQPDATQGASERDYYPGSAFTPDSRALITSYGGKIMRVEVPSGEASEIPFTVEVEQELGPLVTFDYPIDDDQLIVSQIRGARPSPDGERIAFVALDRLWVGDLPEGRGGPGGSEMDHPTITDARRLTSMDVVEHMPLWSPDGSDIYYVTWDDSEGGHIYRMSSDGKGEPERLTPEGAYYDKLSISGDGAKLVALKGSKMYRMRTLEDFGSVATQAELQYVWLPTSGGEPEAHHVAEAGVQPPGKERAALRAGRIAHLHLRGRRGTRLLPHGRNGPKAGRQARWRGKRLPGESRRGHPLSRRRARARPYPAQRVHRGDASPDRESSHAELHEEPDRARSPSHQGRR